MPVNKDHPKYAEYIAKCEGLADQQWKELETIPYTGGQDGPSGDIYRKYAKKLKDLQNEYVYLFT